MCGILVQKHEGTGNGTAPPTGVPSHGAVLLEWVPHPEPFVALLRTTQPSRASALLWPASPEHPANDVVHGLGAELFQRVGQLAQNLLRSGGAEEVGRADLNR